MGEFSLGQRLGEERLAAAIGVSRTPIREALTRLHAEGLVRRHPEGGFEPAFPELDRIGELYEVRQALEAMALRRSVGAPSGRSTAHDRAALEDLHRDWASLALDAAAGADPEFVLLDEDFHVRLALASGNGAVADLLVGVNERIRIVRVHDFLTEGRIRATVGEHLSVLEALLDDDLETAARRLANHIDLSAEVASSHALVAVARMLGRRG
jgi:DNA-binding GntR family transcriptional regulator